MICASEAVGEMRWKVPRWDLRCNTLAVWRFGHCLTMSTEFKDRNFSKEFALCLPIRNSALACDALMTSSVGGVENKHGGEADRCCLSYFWTLTFFFLLCIDCILDTYGWKSFNYSSSHTIRTVTFMNPFLDKLANLTHKSHLLWIQHWKAIFSLAMDYLCYWASCDVIRVKMC